MDKKQQKQKLIEGEDFYLENGMYVFTGKYLMERGFCCESGCRHCPYGFQTKKAIQFRKSYPSNPGLAGGKPF